MTSSEELPKKRSRVNTIVKLAIIAVIVAVLIVLARQFNVQELFIQALEWIRGLGVWGPFIFVGLYIVTTVTGVPGTILTLGAGIVFGVVQGSICVSIGSTLGATAAFLVGRYLARGWVAKQLEDKPRFSAIDRAIAKEGWKIVGLLRLSPVFPFNLLNYGLSVTQVSLRDYFLASWIGMMPGTVMYVYLGSLAGNLATLGAAGQQTSPVEWVIRIVGLLATVAVTVYVTKIARKALNEELEGEAIATELGASTIADPQATHDA
ncbi:MAG: TVP38/TMEM64 family protein [Spirulinaceae cyanobacterium RM2_2_10]|nr:TVP38/TMEM64 family protein [Spirulinaceae cyanobacterium SM2_1_0]NJO20339.1 TVP38/TMEM64 family protein [Spirulinaceae cyanobacterium RM2_2_10]